MDTCIYNIWVIVWTIWIVSMVAFQSLLQKNLNFDFRYHKMRHIYVNVFKNEEKKKQNNEHGKS